MTKRFTSRLTDPIKKNSKRLYALLALGSLPFFMLAQPTYTFTSCGATGQNGPTQAQINTGYSLTNLSGSVTATGGIQSFTVPVTGNYRIDAAAASGGNNAGGIYIRTGGLGARLTGEFNLSAGTVLNIIVGQKGVDGIGTGGGGGGSYVTANNVLLIAAGAGGGPSSDVNGVNGVTVTAGTQDNPAASPGGSNGSGGGACAGTSYNAGGGGGYIAGVSGNGASAPNGGSGGFSFLNGGVGGAGISPGGFGGGGGASQTTVGGGGGGGYSGGAGGMLGLSPCTPGLRSGGGGGGSYNTGANATATAGINLGDGRVMITALCNINLATTSSNGSGAICAGQSATLTTNAISNYVWNTGANTSSIVVSPTITTSYTLTATSPSNCTASSVITVSVDSGTPTVSAVGSPTALCAGKTAVFTATGATTYTWAGPSPVTNGVAFTPPASGSYTVTGANGCGTSTAVVSVQVDPLPNIGGAANNPTVCFGTQVTLNGTGSAGGYTWTGGAANNTPFTPPVGTNTYIVTGNGNTALSCTNSAVVTVTVFQTPTVTPVSTPTAICVGKTATLSAVGATNGYTWSTTPAIFTSTAAVAPVVTTTYSVIRASSSCTSIATVTVVVNPLPNLLVGAPNPSVACAGNCATVTGQGAITYTWYPGGFQGGVITVCPNSSTNYTVVASNANCTTSATSSLTVLPNPVITVNSSTSTVCAGSPVTMTASGASTYTWGSAIPVAQQNQTVVTSSPLTPTLYTVSGTDANGCTSVGNQVILTQTAPNLTTSIVNTGSFICAGQVGTLVAVGNNPVNYNWINTGASAGTTTVNPAVTTVYTVTGTNPNNGCTSTSTLSLAVYISTFVATSPTAICRGNTATLSVAGAANTYSWSAGTPNNNDSIFVSPQNTITYYVTGMTGNCTTTQSINLVVNPIPPVTGVAQKITICRFEPAVLLGSGASDYVWTGGAGATTPNYTVFPQITTTYTLTGTDVNGCSKTVQVTQLVATCIGIEEQSNLAGLLNIYPNPSNGEFTIQAGTGMNITIINELGQLVSSFVLNEKDSTVQVKGLAHGIYFIRAEKDGNAAVKKAVINH
jgi:hypothetical protein